MWDPKFKKGGSRRPSAEVDDLAGTEKVERGSISATLQHVE